MCANTAPGSGIVGPRLPCGTYPTLLFRLQYMRYTIQHFNSIWDYCDTKMSQWSLELFLNNILISSHYFNQICGLGFEPSRPTSQGSGYLTLPQLRHEHNNLRAHSADDPRVLCQQWSRQVSLNADTLLRKCTWARYTTTPPVGWNGHPSRPP